MRDDFPLSIKRIVAQRVAFRCSNPKCRRLTTGPQSDESKVLNLGVCSHISAASPNGPRYNLDISSDERRSVGNAIWLCQFCARLIDIDPLKYPVNELNRWKLLAEKEVREEIEDFTEELARGARGITWTWDEDRSTYRNQQTGEIVGPREIIDERDIFLQNVEASFDLLVDKLFDGTLSIQEWQAEFRKDLKSTYIVCFTLADGGFNNFSDPKKYEIQEILRSEYRSLYDFALDISDGKYSHNGDVWEREQVKLRARSFVHAVQKAVQWP